MDHAEFRVKAKEMVEYIADYLENIRDRRVFPGVQPGYLHKRLPTEAPEQPEKWDDIFKDIEEHIMPGVVHWQSPHMHAYFPALTSYPSIMGEMLCSAINGICFTWAASPAGTELETITMNWLGKILGLPDCFLNEKHDSLGGGVIQTTASEATLVSLLAARTQALMELSKLNPDMQSSELLGHLIGYCSDQAHSSVEKAGLIGLVRLRYIESDENQSMTGAKLEEAILADKAKGLVPFWVCATLGTTGTVAFDKLREIGEVCTKHAAWLHVDAAYAGTSFFCPEYRHWLDGVELADSFAFNPSKWLMVNFDCTAMWVKDSTALHRTFNVNPIYLRHENSGRAIDYMVGAPKSDKIKKIHTKDAVNSDANITQGKNIDINQTYSIVNGNDNDQNVLNGDTNLYENGHEVDEPMDDLYDGSDKNYDLGLHGYDKMSSGCGTKIQLENPDKKEFLHWQIPLSRRFRSLKLWFVLRNYGISGIQKHVRESVRLAQKFEALVLADQRFEVPQPRNLGMVVFRLKGDNTLTERLLKRLNARGHMYSVPACFKNIYVIRFTVTSPKTTVQDILDDWNEIKTVASEILIEMFGSENGNIVVSKKPRITLKDAVAKRFRSNKGRKQRDRNYTETRELNATFGTSLLLANSPMSPKIVNGTHAAICDYEQVLTSCAQTFAQLKMELKDSPEMRRRVRGLRMSGKMFSLDSCMDMVQGLVVESLPQCSEDDKEDASNGSSPGERPSPSLSPVSNTTKQDTVNNQLHIPSAPPRQYRSKSVDVNLAGLKIEGATVTIVPEKNEIVITPTGSKTLNEMTIREQDCESSDDKNNFADKITQVFENFQGGFQMINPFEEIKECDDEKVDAESKVTIRGPGSYIKKLIQQFSEGSFEAEDARPESERAASSMIGKADAICKKCLHYKGRIPK